MITLWLACAPAAPEVVVYTSVDRVYSEPVLRAFEAESGIRVKALFDTEETKSTGVLARLLSEADAPAADVFWSGDPARAGVVAARGLAEPFVPSGAAFVPDAFRDPAGAWTGVSARARVLLVNRERLPDEAGWPASVRDLADPRFAGQGAMASPLYGTTTMHVAALAAAWGEFELLRFLDAVKANGTRIAASNGEVKRLVVAGEVAFGLTDTDDAAEAVTSGAPVAIAWPDAEGAGTLVMPTAVVLVKGGPHPEQGEALVERLVSAVTEAHLAAHGAHLPLRPDVTPPAGMVPMASVRALAVDPATVAAQLDALQPRLREWSGL